MRISKHCVFRVLTIMMLFVLITGCSSIFNKDKSDSHSGDSSPDSTEKPITIAENNIFVEDGDYLRFGDMLFDKRDPTHMKMVHQALVAYGVIDDSQSLTAQGFSYTDIPLWSNGTVYYQLDSKFTNEEKYLIHEATDIWENHTGVTFKPCASGATLWCLAVVRTDLGEYAAGSATLGQVYNPILKLNPGRFDLHTIVHELGHVLGLKHEHQRPDRDSYISILWKNVPESLTRDFERLPNSTGWWLWGAEAIKSSVYDYDSVMHYGEYIGTKSGDTLHVIDSKGQAISRSDRPSALDFQFVQTLYNRPAPINEVFLSNASSFYNSGVRWESQYGTAPNGWYVGDFNGDGRSDILKYKINAYGARVFYSSRLNPMFTDDEFLMQTALMTRAGYGSAQDGWYVGDFNGDGTDDLLRYHNGSEVFLGPNPSEYHPSKRVFTYTGSWTPAGYGHARAGWYVGDFNGDGKDDLMRYNNGVGTEVLLSNGSSFASPRVWSLAGYGHARDGWYVGDFNGDGKDDIMRYNNGVGTEVLLSNGVSFGSPRVWSRAGYGHSSKGWYVGDFNGDGKDDIMRYNNGVGTEVFTSNGTSFVYTRVWTSAGYGNARDGWYVADFDGDGKDDVLRYISR